MQGIEDKGSSSGAHHRYLCLLQTGGIIPLNPVVFRKGKRHRVCQPQVMILALPLSFPVISPSHRWGKRGWGNLHEWYVDDNSWTLVKTVLLSPLRWVLFSSFPLFWVSCWPNGSLDQCRPNNDVWSTYFNVHLAFLHHTKTCIDGYFCMAMWLIINIAIIILPWSHFIICLPWA